MLTRFIVCLSISVIFVSLAHAGAKDDPVLLSVNLERLEMRDPGGDDGLYLEGGAWLGKDASKLWLKAEVERVHGLTDEAEIQVLYSVPIATYWDIYAGVRQDIKPDPSRTWAVLSIDGLAPGFIELETSLFVGESGRTALRLEVDHEITLSQQWTLRPEIEVYLAGQNDESMGVGAGVSEIEASLLLSYQVHQQFSPYVGINWTKSYGKTADYAREEGEETSDTVFVVGVSTWF